MSGYLTRAQVDKLLEPINPRRVGKDGKGFSHIEAYEARAHLNRVFGFGRWSEEVTSQDLIFETDNGGKWTVCYRSVVKVTVCAPDGTPLAVYAEGATGEAKNQPHRGDAHDLALKTSQSQAFKRAIVNLGDNFGLSLYAKGSLKALVYRTLVLPDETDESRPDDQAMYDRLTVDEHVTEVPPETPAAPPEPDPQGDTGGQQVPQQIAEKALAAQTKAQLTRLMLEASQAGVIGATVPDGDGGACSLETLIQRKIREAA